MIKTQWHHALHLLQKEMFACVPIQPILFNAFSLPLWRKTLWIIILLRTISPSHFSLWPFYLFLSRQHILLSILSSIISTCKAEVISESQTDVSSTPLKVKHKRERWTLEWFRAPCPIIITLFVVLPSLHASSRSTITRYLCLLHLYNLSLSHLQYILWWDIIPKFCYAIISSVWAPDFIYVSKHLHIDPLPPASSCSFPDCHIPWCSAFQHSYSPCVPHR